MASAPVLLGGLIGSSLFLQNPIQTRSYALADSREVRDLFQDAQAHIEAQRWTQGLGRLQKIIEEHPNELLPSEGDLGTFWGAARHAEKKIQQMPREARDQYESLFGAQAKAFLQEALARRDFAGLRRLSERFGLTESGAQALLVLGDFALERADWVEARLCYESYLEKVREGQADTQIYFRLGLAYRHLSDLDAISKLSSQAQEIRIEESGQKRELQNRLELWKQELQRAPAIPLVRGPAVIPPRMLPSEPGGQGQVSWRFPDQEGVFERPFDPEAGYPDPFFNFFPSMEGDRVFLSDSISVFAVDLYSGREAWRFRGASGWERVSEREKQSDFFGTGINPHTLVAGASSAGITLFTLQVPLKIYEKKDFQGIPIKTVIPTRRLFALDNETGKLVWSHWRPELARLGVGDFVDSTSAAAPPIIVGDRVFLPLYRMEGKIDYYMACFELRTGKMVWKTPIVTGQLELNMFGRPIREFAGSPALYHVGNLYFSTNLGVSASVEASTGKIRWVSPYQPIPIQAANSYTRVPRNFYWANQAPFASEDLLFMAPLDSQELYRIDLETGETYRILTYDYNYRGRRLGLRHILGIAQDKLFISGLSLTAIATKEGMGAPRFSILWSRPLNPEMETSRANRFPRGLLTDRSVLVPSFEGIESYSIEDGTPSPQKWYWQVRSRDLGNLTLGQGIALVSSDHYVEARFDWQALLQKTRRAAASNETSSLERLGRLLRRRADSLTQGPEPDLEQALPLYIEAGEILEKLFSSGNPGAGRELFDLYLGLGEMESRRGMFRNAEEYLRKAKSRAPGPNEKVQALLALSEFFAKHQATQSLQTVFEELEKDYSLQRIRVGGFDRPVGLHVLLHKIERAKNADQLSETMRLLHEILARYPQEKTELGVASDFARAQVQALIVKHGREIYEPFEQLAEEKRKRAQEEKGRDALLDLIQLYPNSKAALQAHASLMEIAVLEKDPATAADICRRYLAENKDPQTAASMLRRLALVFAESGNRSLSDALLRKLALQYGPWSSDLALDQGKSYSALARPIEAPSVLPSPKLPLSPDRDISLAYNSLQVLHPYGESPLARGHLLLLADQELRCYLPAESGGLETPIWRVALDPEEPGSPMSSLFGNVLTIVTAQTIQSFDLSTGRRLWVRTSKSRIFDATAQSGMVLTFTQERNQAYQCEAIDAVRGVTLWSLTLRGEQGPKWILGEGEIAFLPILSKDSRVEVFDLFTGNLETTLEVPRAQDVLAGILMERVLILSYPPALQRNANPDEKMANLRGFPLDSKQLPWKFELPSKYSLHSFLLAKTRPYLIVTAKDPRDAEGGIVYSILPKEGQTQEVLSLPAGAILPGLLGRTGIINAQDSEDLLILHADNRGFLRAILSDLSTGKTRWKRPLPQMASQIADRGNAPAALTGSELVFLPVQTTRPSGQGIRTEVLVLDRKTSETVSTTFALFDRPDEGNLEIVLLPEMVIIQQGLQLRRLQGGR